MKKVFSSANECIHIYAQRTQNEGRSSNVFFEGDKIYSYGHHYLLGEFITNPKGKQAIIINDKGYSVTTAKHINWLTHGTSHYKQFFTTQCFPDLVLKELENLAQKLRNARKKELYISPAEYLYTKFLEFQTWNESNSPLIEQINAIIQVFRGKDVNEYFAEKAELIKKAEEKKKKELIKQYKKELQEFFEYKRNYTYKRLNDEDYIRISEDNTKIESSQGVKVSVNIALILYKKILAKEDIKGFQIENYTVIGINGTLQIGCHKINKKNMHEIGQKLLSQFS